MRYLRIFTVILFVCSLLFAWWGNDRYYSSLNRDYPVLTSQQEQLQISVQDGPEALLQQLQAQDATDGDLTDQIMVASVSHFFEPGTVNVKYVVFDSHNNSATLTRQVHYTDYTPPVFILDKSPVYTLGSSFDLVDHIQVLDCIEGDISDRIRVVSNKVNSFTPGNYPVLLEVSNSFGDTQQLNLWVTYQNQKNTASVKLHRYIHYLPQGEAFEPQSCLASLTDMDGVSLDPANLQIQGHLDVDTPGFYQLIYSYADDTHTGQAALTVVVTERQG